MDLPVETIELPSHPKPADVVTLLERLCGLRTTGVLISAARADHLTAHQFQVLCAARDQWAKDGVPLSIIDTNPRFTGALALFGINPDDFATKDGE